MTVQHAVVAFPRFDAPERVEALRRRFDPLSAVIAAHVTLVFPFEQGDSSFSLIDHVATVARDVAPFAIAFAEPTVEDDEYLMLNIAAGGELLTALHDRLYAEPLARHLSRVHAYRPHVTLGRLESSSVAVAAVATARRILAAQVRARIDSLAIFRLEPGPRGAVACILPLGRVG
jgi:2'-5' RNA ligase